MEAMVPGSEIGWIVDVRFDSESTPELLPKESSTENILFYTCLLQNHSVATGSL